MTLNFSFIFIFMESEDVPSSEWSRWLILGYNYGFLSLTLNVAPSYTSNKQLSID